MDGVLVCACCAVIFIGKLSPNFDLENLISTYKKDFLWKKSATMF
jgi:hypothetical protein